MLLGQKRVKLGHRSIITSFSLSVLGHLMLYHNYMAESTVRFVGIIIIS